MIMPHLVMADSAGHRDCFWFMSSLCPPEASSVMLSAIDAPQHIYDSEFVETKACCNRIQGPSSDPVMTA